MFLLLGLLKIHTKISVRLLKKSSYIRIASNTFFRNNFYAVKYLSDMAAYRNKNILRGFMDRYDGITIASDVETCDETEFPIKLEESLKYWEKQKIRGVWFKVFEDHSVWVPFLTRNGFKFHHAKNDYVMLYRWLPKDQPCGIPPYAHTTVGVGSVVINENNEILVVSERHWKVPHWKLPGGHVDPGENLVDAAIREVFEETNIKTQFETLLTLRHGHGGSFGCSDLYVVMALKPLNTDIQKAQHELEDCRWMNVDEYMTHPHVHKLNRLFVENYLHYKEHNLCVDCKHDVHPILKKPYTVYHVVKDKL